MKKFNILVTGVGAIIGYGVISSLRKCKYDVNIVGMDIYESAVGKLWCDAFVQSILASEENYCTFLVDVIEKYSIDLVFFGTEQEIIKCIECKKQLGEYYKKLVINNEELIEIANDKWSTICFLKEHHLNYIPSSIEYDFEEAFNQYGLPLLMKPRRSYASKGIEVISSKDNFLKWKEMHESDFMVQKYIGDDNHEFTAATFGFGNGKSIKPIVMKRKLSKAGATDYAQVIEMNSIAEEIQKLCSCLNPLGPTNFQFRIQDDTPYLLEINPRISSSTSIRTAFGYNEAEMCLEYYLMNKQPHVETIKKGTAYRYIKDEILYENGSDF